MAVKGRMYIIMLSHLPVIFIINLKKKETLTWLSKILVLIHDCLKTDREAKEGYDVRLRHARSCNKDSSGHGLLEHLRV